MQLSFVQEVKRVKPFGIEALPWVLRVYRSPFDRWTSPGRQALFGAPNLLLFFLYQRLWPFPGRAHFVYRRQGREMRIRFNPKNSQYRALYLSEFATGYEPLTTSLVSLLTPPQGVFYDIGSNWGWFSLALAAREDFRGKIHAFEPFAPSYADLRSIVSQAGLEEMINCHPVALSDRCGTGTMSLPDYVQSGLATLDDSQVARGMGTQMATLDSLALEPPYVMKVDVEGAELKVFSGGGKLISQHKPMIVFEHSPTHADPLENLKSILFLRDLGYAFYRLAWLKQRGGAKCLVGDNLEHQPQPTETLALAEFEPTERFLFTDSLNIFACHRDRTPDLERHFRRA
jgi:FkbM family methyltransferase